MIGVSVDSFVDATNRTIGRVTRGSKLLDQKHLQILVDHARSINRELLVKLNTVVCSANLTENMCDGVNRIRPDKWKIFRVLPQGGKRNMLITEQDFAQFVARHKGNVNTVMRVEDNDAMTESYIMVDPLGRFIQNSGPQGSLIFSTAILTSGASRAFSQVRVLQDRYDDRYNLAKIQCYR